LTVNVNIIDDTLLSAGIFTGLIEHRKRPRTGWVGSLRDLVDVYMLTKTLSKYLPIYARAFAKCCRGVNFRH